MILIGAVGAERVRPTLLGTLSQAPTGVPVQQVGPAWLAGPPQLGRPAGPHVHAEIDGHGIVVTSDPWAYWPVYIMPVEDGVTFSTRLATLLALHPERDYVGSMEKVMVGTPLGGRTPYASISRVRPGETVRINLKGVDSEIRPFWREPLSGGGSEIASRLRKVTGEVLGDARRVTALLSGGLDSRVVVSLLMEQNADVSALNFGQPGTQDEVFAREFAEHAGVRFYHMPRDPRECGHLNMARRRIEAYGLASDMPSVVWTGLGASNLLGGVHVTEQVAIRLRAGDLGGAAAALCASEGYAIPRRLFSGDVAALEAAVRANMAAEFEHYATRDMAHAFTLYLLFNRERAGAEVANEGIAEHGLYAVSPFIDEQVLRLALGIDTLELAGHHWYHRWLSELSPVVRSVPWQAYPGHEPCPVPIPAALQDQWQSNDAWREGNRTRQRRKALRALASSHVRREVLAAALILDTLGLRDCSHTIDAAAVFARQ